MGSPTLQGKVLSLSLSLANSVTFDYLFKKHERLRVGHSAAKYPEKRFVVNGIEELSDIAPPNKTVSIAGHEILRPLYCFQKAFSCAARPHIIDKCLVEYRHQIFIQYAVQNAVGNGRNHDFAGLVVVYGKAGVWSMPIGARLKDALKMKKILLKIRFKVDAVFRASLATPKQAPCAPNIFNSHVY